MGEGGARGGGEEGEEEEEEQGGRVRKQGGSPVYIWAVDSTSNQEQHATEHSPHYIKRPP